MKFTDRIYWLEQTDTIVHIGYLQHNFWSVEHLRIMGGEWRWVTTDIRGSYQGAFQSVAHYGPVLLMEEK